MRARAELERLKSALRARGLEGVEWEPIPIAPTDPVAAAAETLTAAAPAGDAGRLLAIAFAVLDACPWSSVPCVSVFVDSVRRRAVLRADVLVFDPVETLRSAPAKAAAAGGAAPDPVAREVWRVLHEVVAGAGVDADRQFDYIREALSAANMAYGGDRAELLAQALEGLPPEAASLVGDMILLTRREGDHQRTRESLEELIENELHTPAGRLRGREISHGAWARPPRRLSGFQWGDDPKMGGGNELSDLSPMEGGGDLDVEIARLGAAVEDDDAVERTRLDALTALEAIDHREARAWRLRALGHSRLYLNAIVRAPLGEAESLFREIVLCRDDRRVAGALSLLKRYGRDGLDGAAIWAKSATQPLFPEEVRVASLYRHCVIERFAELADEAVAKAIRAELAEHRDDPLWIGAAQTLLSSVEARTRKPPPIPRPRAQDTGDAAAEEAAITGKTPEEIAERRFSLWLSAGYASRRYRQSGHRDPKWDADVEAAHDAYCHAKPHAGAHPHIVAAYERAISNGCTDGIVLYRSGACAQFRGDHAAGEKRLAAAVDRIAELYPLAPYVSSASIALARYANKAGRFAEALAWARRGAAHPARETGAAAFAASLEVLAEMREVAARLPDAGLGTVRPAAGRKHSHPVTCLAVNTLPEPVAASCDSGGIVQISLVEYHAEARALVPVFRDAFHAPGRTVVAWAAETLLVSAGGDCLVKEIDAADPRAPQVRKEHHADAPVTAITRGSSFAGPLVLGDAAGRVFAFVPGSGGIPVQPLARFRLGELRRVLVSPVDPLLVAVDLEGRAAVLDESGPRLLDLSVPLFPETLAFVESGFLRGFGGGSGWTLDARTGTVVSESPQQEKEPVAVRRGPGGRELTAHARGSVSVQVGPRGGVEYAGGEPIALVDVAWERGVVVMATRAGWLRTTEFRG